jgi:hypothetical protein
MVDPATWPADPADPRCPACDGKVAATSSYCMHCETDLPPADFSPAETESGLDADFAAATTGDDADGAGDGGDGWLPSLAPDPDGLADDVSTVAVGAVGGFLAGVAATVTLLFPLPTYWPFAVGITVWVAGTVWIAATRSVFGAVRKAGYLLGGWLAFLPVAFALAAPMATDTVGSRLGFLVVLGVFVWPLAAVAGGVGFLGGRLAGGE